MAESTSTLPTVTAMTGNKRAATLVRTVETTDVASAALTTEFREFLSTLGAKPNATVACLKGYGSRLSEEKTPFRQQALGALRGVDVVVFDGDWLKDESFTSVIPVFLEEDPARRAVGFRKASGNATKMLGSWEAHGPQLGVLLVQDELVKRAVAELGRLRVPEKDQANTVLGWLTAKISGSVRAVAVGGGVTCVLEAEAWARLRSEAGQHVIPQWEVLNIGRAQGGGKGGWEEPADLVKIVRDNFQGPVRSGILGGADDSLHALAEAGNFDAVNEWVKGKGSDGNESTNLPVPGIDHLNERFDKYTPLHLAAKRGHKSTVELLIRANADVNSENENERQTPLVLAVLEGHEQIVEMLIKNGADLSFKGKGENTLLHEAVAIQDRVEITRALISKHDALVSERNAVDDLPLHVAVRYTGEDIPVDQRVSAEVVELLVQKYEQATKENGGHGKLPLELAVGGKSPLKVVQALLVQGKLLDEPADREGRTFRDIAQSHSVTEVRQWARKFGCFLERYRLQYPAVHTSKTSRVFFAIDEAPPKEDGRQSPGGDNNSAARVCVKCMKDLDQFKAEITARRVNGTPLSDDTVVKLLRWHTPADEPFSDGHREQDEEATEDRKYPYVLVLVQGLRSLHDACAKERMAGAGIGRMLQTFKCIAVCVDKLHNAGLVHGDLKQRNVLQKLNANSDEIQEEEWILCDMDAAARLGEPIGKKSSSAYAPPELARIKALPDGGEEYSNTELPTAERSFDVWSLGVILFELCVGRTLFAQDINDDELVSASWQGKLGLWAWQTIDDKILDHEFAKSFAVDDDESRVSEDLKSDAKHLVRWALQGDPTKRPTMEEILNHRLLQRSETASSPLPFRNSLGAMDCQGPDPIIERTPRDRGHLVGTTPKEFHGCVEAGDVDKAKKLLRQGRAHCRMEWPNCSQILPIHRAARRGDINMLEALIATMKPEALKAALNIQTPPYNYTALHWCAACADSQGRYESGSDACKTADYEKVAQLLIDKGCKTGRLTYRGQTAWDLAEQVGAKNLIQKVFESSDYHAISPLLASESKLRKARPKVADTYREDIKLEHNRLVFWDTFWDAENERDTSKGFESWELVGEGGFGAVYRVRNVSPAMQVANRIFDSFAVKVPKEQNPGLGDRSSSRDLEQHSFKRTTSSARQRMRSITDSDESNNGVKELKQEVEMLARLQHINVVQMLGMSYGPAPNSEGASRWMMCLEYCESDLEKRIYGTTDPATKPKGVEDHLEVAKIIDFALQVAEGMAYVHAEGILHRDLKPENILLANEGCTSDPTWVCKVADFGMPEEVESTWTGTSEYMSPEATGQLKPNPSIGPKVDVFSFGIVLWEMLAWQRVRFGFDAVPLTVWVNKQTGEPFRGPTGMPGSGPVKAPPGTETELQEDYRSVAMWMMKGGRPKTNPQWPHGLLLLMQACWAQDADARPTFDQVKTALISMRDAPNDHPLLSSPPPTEAKAWLKYNHFGEDQVEVVLSYVQQEGTAGDIKGLDKDDFEEMIAEMKMGREDDARFRELVAALDEEKHPTDALMKKVGNTSRVKELVKQIMQLGLEDVESIEAEITAMKQNGLVSVSDP